MYDDGEMVVPEGVDIAPPQKIRPLTESTQEVEEEEGEEEGEEEEGEGEEEEAVEEGEDEREVWNKVGQLKGESSGKEADDSGSDGDPAELYGSDLESEGMYVLRTNYYSPIRI